MIDLIFVVSAVAFNLLIAGVYITTRQGSDRWVRRLGITFIALAVPFGIVLLNALLSAWETWKIAILGLTLAYILVELLFDFILKIDFRSKPILHIPYLILFYIVLFGLIGIAFAVDPVWGWLISISFWLLLASLIYMILGRRRKKQAK